MQKPILVSMIIAGHHSALVAVFSKYHRASCFLIRRTLGVTSTGGSNSKVNGAFYTGTKRADIQVSRVLHRRNTEHRATTNIRGIFSCCEQKPRHLFPKSDKTWSSSVIRKLLIIPEDRYTNHCRYDVMMFLRTPPPPPPPPPPPFKSCRCDSIWS